MANGTNISSGVKPSENHLRNKSTIAYLNKVSFFKPLNMPFP